jgi:anti-anti-sigma regulatory factor
MKTRRKQSGARGTANRSAKTVARKTAPRKPAVKRTAAGAAVSRARASSTANPVTTVGTDCTIEHAPGLHEQLAKVLASRACVTVDVTAVKRCDTAGLQVLAAFVRERREAGRDVSLAGASDNFVATAKLIGLGSLFFGETAAAAGGERA